MKTINKKEPVVWQLDTWYDKTFYVIGQIWSILFTIGFIMGVIGSLSN